MGRRQHRWEERGRFGLLEQQQCKLGGADGKEQGPWGRPGAVLWASWKATGEG